MREFLLKYENMVQVETSQYRNTGLTLDNQQKPLKIRSEFPKHVLAQFDHKFM